jgi:carbamoyl-phosphate synthase large subunit
MPRNNSINSVLIIGSGPIIIGQACEFDYSGTQASKSLREEGVEVILINDNPATIMTDPQTADKVYMWPLTPESIVKILKKHKPDCVLPTMGGQTALNLCKECEELGIWKEHSCKIIGVDLQTIEITENRDEFRKFMKTLDIGISESIAANSFEMAEKASHKLGFPLVVRPSFTLGGFGGGFAENFEEFETVVKKGLEASPISQVLVEKAVLGWKEYELELLKDCNDNVTIVCSIENLDPMGVHTGDSITIAPAMTLSDTVFQKMRDMAIKMMRNLGTFAGGCNVQFAVDPHTENIIAVEVNPRVSRSSALASKATGYPIARISAKLALGYNLDEIKNPIVNTSAMFEPSLDYVVVKVPKWNFEKFPKANDTLGLQMRSVGESMAIGRNFNEALQKAIQGLEEGKSGLISKEYQQLEDLSRPTCNRIYQIKRAIEIGESLKKIHHITKIDSWFLQQIKDLVKIENSISKKLSKKNLLLAKQNGFSDEQISTLSGKSVDDIFYIRQKWGITRIFKSIDTCSAEFKAKTPYFYSTFERPINCLTSQNESHRSSKSKKVLFLGSGPNRIGQGIEFDYACVHGVLGAKDNDWETIMINNNPETVSTDFNLADKLYFEPVYLDHVLEIIKFEKPNGVIVQLGGQTALKLTKKLHELGIKILGTDFKGIDGAEDRDQFYHILDKNNIKYPKYNVVESIKDINSLVIQFPVLIRPSYVIGGQRMKIINNIVELKSECKSLLETFEDNTIIIDEFIEGAVEVEVDLISDGEDIHIIGVMEHVDKAGVHSGDSHSYLPTKNIKKEILTQIEKVSKIISAELNIIGLINIQFVIKDDLLYVIEANPRSSRTVPFISKANGIPYIKIATGIILGEYKLKNYTFPKVQLNGWALKQPVFSTHKFGVDIELGPEMKSTGERIIFED